MKRFVRTLIIAAFGAALGAAATTSCVAPSDNPLVPMPGVASGSTVNLFSTLAAKSQAEVDARLLTAIDRFFGIGTGESATPTAATGYRCYYELPQDATMAFIWSADSDDIRTEGMSYGMMIAVQANLRTQFDKLWKFAKTYMQYPSSSAGDLSAWRHYFRWQLTNVDASDSSSWTWATPDVSPASDGEEYFAMALYLADRRWGSDGSVDYKAEADLISDAMINNAAAGAYYPIIHATEDMVSFCPIGSAYGFTDPSYHLPSFYECFAAWGPAANSARWMAVAGASRAYFAASANAATGLHPDYATYGGTPVADGAGTTGDGIGGTAHDTFRYDAWRVPMNMAMDYAWFGGSPALKGQIEKYHAFFASYKGTNNVADSLFSLDGSNASGGGSTALTATLAAASMASEHADRAFWVNALWNAAQQSGKYRYYQECVYILGMLNVAGKYGTSW
jgi:oligosaccharide reducing-end xylanase